MERMAENSGNRREFLRRVGRGLALGTLGLAGGALAARAIRRGEDCLGRGVCGRCVALGRCALPLAQSFKRTKRGPSRG